MEKQIKEREREHWTTKETTTQKDIRLVSINLFSNNYDMSLGRKCLKLPHVLRVSVRYNPQNDTWHAKLQNHICVSEFNRGKEKEKFDIYNKNSHIVLPSKVGEKNKNHYFFFFFEKKGLL